MRRNIALLLLPGVFALVSCSRSLDRGDAAKLIEANVRFVEPKSVNVPVGKVWFDYRNFHDAFPLRELEGQGLVTVFETGRSSGMWNKEYAVRLTSAGETAKASWTRTDEKVNSWFAPPSPDAVIYAIPVAKRKLDEVTGIRAEGNDENQAVAEFTWHWEPTETGHKLGKTPPIAPQKTEASFQRYDDGWRVARLQLTIFD